MQTYLYKLSIVVPIHDMPNGAYFLWRLIQSLTQQSFQDFELIITKEGKMAENTNAGIARAKGELIKVLYMDDYLAHPDALQRIVENFQDEDDWLVTGCLHQEFESVVGQPHLPVFSESENTIGSPSVLTIRNDHPLFFDENLSWLLDLDLYKRYHAKYGEPKILNDYNVIIGLHPGQTTHVLSDEEKLSEYEYLAKRYA